MFVCNFSTCHIFFGINLCAWHLNHLLLVDNYLPLPGGHVFTESFSLVRRIQKISLHPCLTTQNSWSSTRNQLMTLY